MTTPPRRGARLAVRDRLRALRPSSEVDDTDHGGWMTALLSLVVALTLWFTFSMRETYTVSVRVPIEVAALPSGQALRESPPATVAAQVQGEGWDLLAFTRGVPAVRVAAESPTVDVVTALSEGGLPSGIAVVGAQPRTFVLALDTRTSRRVPIRFVSDLSLAPSFGLIRPPQLSPDSVVVSGAQSLLGGLRDWPTQPFALKDIRQSTTRWVLLQDTLGGLLEPDRRQTLVSIQVGRFTEGERLLDIVVQNRPPGAPTVRFDPAQVRAVYRVPSDDTYERAAETPQFVAVVDYRDIARDTTDGAVPLRALVPSGLDVRDVVLTPSRAGYFLIRPRVAPPAGEHR